MVDPTVSCTTCGDPLTPGNAFCTGCGTPVDGQASAGPPPAPPPPPPPAAPPSADREVAAQWGGPRRGAPATPSTDVPPAGEGPAPTPPPAPAGGDTVALWPAPAGAAAPPPGAVRRPGGGRHGGGVAGTGRGRISAHRHRTAPGRPTRRPRPGSCLATPDAPRPAGAATGGRGAGGSWPCRSWSWCWSWGPASCSRCGSGATTRPRRPPRARPRRARGPARPPRPSTTAPVTATTGSRPALRQARLDAGIAVLRDEPSPDGAKIRSIRDEEATDIAVLEELDENDGWYRVRIGDNEGYLFGALLDPPQPRPLRGPVARQARGPRRRRPADPGRPVGFPGADDGPGPVGGLVARCSSPGARRASWPSPGSSSPPAADPEGAARRAAGRAAGRHVGGRGEPVAWGSGAPPYTGPTYARRRPAPDLDRVLHRPRPHPGGLGGADPAPPLGPHVHQLGDDAVRPLLPGRGDGPLRPSPRHLGAEVRARRRQAQRPRRHRSVAAAPLLLRDAGQLQLRRLLQGRGHPLGVGVRHRGAGPRR